MERSSRNWKIDRKKDGPRDVDEDMISDNTICVEACLYVWVLFVHSHDFIGEFTTSYRELSRGQNQFNVYEVRHDMGVVCCFSALLPYEDLVTPIEMILIFSLQTTGFL